MSRGLQVCNRGDGRIAVRKLEGTDISKKRYEAISEAEHTFYGASVPNHQIFNSMLSSLTLGNATSSSPPIIHFEAAQMLAAYISRRPFVQCESGV